VFFRPQSTIACAQILMHRTYFRLSMHVYKLLRVCQTALFLGSKISETPVSLRDVCACFDRVLKRRAGLDPSPLSESRFVAWRQHINSMEVVMLRELGFELYVDTPHAFLLHLLNYLHPHVDRCTPEEQQRWADLQQRAWSALNDALFSPRLVFRYAPHVVACAAIFVAASLLSLAMPAEWWRLFDVRTAELDHAALDLATLYAMLSRYAAPGDTLEYVPTDESDNISNNELCVYRARNRQDMLAEKKRKKDEGTEAPGAASLAATTAATSPTATSAASVALPSSVSMPPAAAAATSAPSVPSAHLDSLPSQTVAMSDDGNDGARSGGEAPVHS